MFKKNEIFKLKNSVTIEDLREIAYKKDTIEWILQQKYFIVSRAEYTRNYRDRIYYYNNFKGHDCYFDEEMCELISPRGHRLTKMFQLT